MAQLRESGFHPSFRQAMPLVADPLPKWDFSAFAWSKDCHLGHRPRSKSTMLEAWKAYQPVLHLWAALLHGEQWGRRDIWPGSNETLPNFLAYADAILDFACDLPSYARERGFALRRKDAWTFTLRRPAEARRLIAVPLYDEQLAMITTSSVART
jgi:hypothetical protein